MSDTIRMQAWAIRARGQQARFVDNSDLPVDEPPGRDAQSPDGSRHAMRARNRPPKRETATGGDVGFRRRGTSDGDCDVLRLEVLVDPLAPALAAEARGLDAAEGGGGVGDDALVEADHAGLQA